MVETSTVHTLVTEKKWPQKVFQHSPFSTPVFTKLCVREIEERNLDYKFVVQYVMKKKQYIFHKNRLFRVRLFSSTHSMNMEIATTTRFNAHCTF